MARSEGLEPPTYKFVACCSIQLSYDRTQPRQLRRFFIFPSTPFLAPRVTRDATPHASLFLITANAALSDTWGPRNKRGAGSGEARTAFQPPGIFFNAMR